MDTLVLLAGGESRRLPHKLERVVDGEPMIVGAYHRFRHDFEVVVSLAAPLPEGISRKLNCRVVYDRYARCGPLAGMLSACETLDCDTLGVVAADLPYVDAPLLTMLREARRDEDEAVIASHDGRIEPLVGWYERRALLREGRAALERADTAVYHVVERLRARFVPMSSTSFVNINTPDDFRALSRASAGDCNDRRPDTLRTPR
jgi:molybdenum cofactor guanylyltransferase